MPTLILIRHAKSDWGSGVASDHARPLNARGQTAAPLIGTALRDRGQSPTQVLCSSAARAQETWAGIETAFTDPPAPEIVHSLYLAAPDTMLDILRSATGETVAMVGHNPGIAALAAMLCATGPDHDRFHDYPTGATLIADVAGWSGLDAGQATVQHFFVPRDLAGHP
ncbi:MAG: histidine phosphatase family protein [Pseudomonadota bacterium]